jgi:hypothetical protein
MQSSQGGILLNKGTKKSNRFNNICWPDNGSGNGVMLLYFCIAFLLANFLLLFDEH